jgi:hypothetical protein
MVSNHEDKRTFPSSLGKANSTECFLGDPARAGIQPRDKNLLEGPRLIACPQGRWEFGNTLGSISVKSTARDKDGRKMEGRWKPVAEACIDNYLRPASFPEWV